MKTLKDGAHSNYGINFTAGTQQIDPRIGEDLFAF